jgi:hypothetical protein
VSAILRAARVERAPDRDSLLVNVGNGLVVEVPGDAFRAAGLRVVTADVSKPEPRGGS